MGFISKSQHNVVFCCIFRLTTWFGLCFVPSSGYKIFTQLRKLHKRKSQSQIHDIEIQQDIIEFQCHVSGFVTYTV
jgi:hypothetical protein